MQVYFWLQSAPALLALVLAASCHRLFGAFRDGSECTPGNDFVIRRFHVKLSDTGTRFFDRSYDHFLLLRSPKG